MSARDLNELKRLQGFTIDRKDKYAGNYEEKWIKNVIISLLLLLLFFNHEGQPFDSEVVVGWRLSAGSIVVGAYHKFEIFASSYYATRNEKNN